MTRRRNPALPLAAQAWRMIVCLAIVALFCRAAIPAGYMPGPSAARAGQVALTLCTGSGPATSLLLDVPGKPADPASDHANGALDCPFGMLASQALLPGLAPQAGLPVLAAASAIGVPAARQTLPPLPPQGPPLGSRAPPARLA